MLFHEYTVTDPDTLNDSLYRRFIELSQTGRVRQTHHFSGRFENIYVDESDIPVITPLLALVKQQASAVLDVPAQTLKAGFWFNAMEAGDLTTPHHHDENDELLSAVYYIRVPGNSGKLVLHQMGKKVRIQPQAGKLVMFAPHVVHEVTVNQGTELRLSVGMNIGPVDG